jgi:hypothetical protein
LGGGDVNLDALDRWITSGRYSSSWGWVTCAGCSERTLVKTETEYGCTTWSPEECSHCEEPFNGDEDWEDED